MPISTRGRSTKTGQQTTLPAHRVEPAIKEKYKGHARHESPNTAVNAKVTNRSLAAHSPEYSVPLTAAVTYIYIFAF